MLHISARKHKKTALVCYIPESYTLPEDHPNFIGHSNFQECRFLLNALSEHGFSCDVAGWGEDVRSLSGKNYDVLIAVHEQLEYGRSLVKKGGKVIFYSTHCHWLFNNFSEYYRLNQLKIRRGNSILPRRQLKPIMLEDQIDEIWYLGNAFQKDSYAHIDVPKHKINISTVDVQVTPKQITDESKNHFLWYSSSGAVHKGLDWLLEIFSKNRKLHLHICGLVELEKDFIAIYKKELFESSNIHFYGWVLPNSEKFRSICDQCLFVVSPTCSEGGGGAILQCMLAGLIPIVTRSSTVDIGNFGFVIENDSIENVYRMILETNQLEKNVLSKKSEDSREFVLSHHTFLHYQKSLIERIKSL